MTDKLTTTRVLTTIFFSDIHGYSGRMQNEEDETFKLLAIHNEVFNQAFRHHHGEVVKTIGDAFMARFEAPSSALQCAVVVQQAITKLRRTVPNFNIQVRIGIHVGEAIESAGDLYGHSVNVAARTEPLAAPGCIALTEDAARQIQRKTIYTLNDRGSRAVKNIGEIRFFEVDPESEALDPGVSSLVASACKFVQKTAAYTSEAASSLPSGGYASIENALIRVGAPLFHIRRESLLSSAIRCVMGGPLHTTAIVGLPGIGKTTLMFGLARELRSSFPFGLALSFDGPASLEPAYVLDEINAFLTSLGRGLEPQALHAQDPQQALGKLAMKMADLDVLVIMDAIDMVPTKWINKIIQAFSSVDSVRVVVTARDFRFDRQIVQTLTVHPLADSEALLFSNGYSRIFGLDIDSNELIARLPQEIWCYPQALVALLMNLRDLPFDLLLAATTRQDCKPSNCLVGEIIASLSEVELSALALMSVLSGLELSKALTLLSLPVPPAFLTSLQILLSKSLVQHLDATYSVPAMVTTSLLEVAPLTLVSERHRVTAALSRVVGSVDEKVELGVLATTTVRVALQEATWGGGDVLHAATDERFLELLNRRGYWKEYCLLLTLGFEAASKLGDRVAHVGLGFRLLRKSLQRKDATDGRLLLSEIEKSIDSVGDTHDRAELCSHRALLYEAENNDGAALRELIECRRIRLVLDDDAGLSIVEKLIGNLHLRHRNYGDARKAFEAAIIKASHDETSKHSLEAATSLALCDLAAGLLSQAESRLRGVLRACETMRFEAGKPRALLNLASVLEQSGRLDEAIEAAQSSFEAADNFDPPIAAVGKLMLSRMKRRRTEFVKGSVQ